MRHEHPVQLRWSDPDSLGHVNHARALSLIEDARLAMVDGPGGSVILAESEERTIHADPDDAQGGHRQSEDTV